MSEMLKFTKQRVLLSCLLLILIPQMAAATAQAPDLLIYNGKTYDLFSNPLEEFYNKNKSKRPKFWVEPHTVSSGNWRGYVATWEIIDDKLFLRKIDSWFCKPSIRTENGCRKVALSDLFGKRFIDGKVFASWFSDKLRVPDGKELKYIHSGYASIYERDIFFDVNSGKIIKQETVDNTKRQLPSDQEVYERELSKLRRESPEETQVNSTQSSALQPNGNSKPIPITENGWGKVVIGADRKVIEKVLGKGHEGSKYEDVFFVEYPQKGVQISYASVSNKAYAIFFYNKQTYYGDFQTTPAATDKGITWNSSPEDVIEAYGKPPREFSDATGGSIWRRLEYDKIDFLFERGRMTRISVHSKLCTGCEEKLER